MYISASKSSDGSYAKNVGNERVYLLWRDSQRYSPHIYDLVRLHARQIEVKTCCVWVLDGWKNAFESDRSSFRPHFKRSLRARTRGRRQRSITASTVRTWSLGAALQQPTQSEYDRSLVLLDDLW